MNNASECAAALKSLLSKSRKRTPEVPESDNPIDLLVFSFLLWESTTAAATKAYRRYERLFVDENDLRVTLPHELADLLGMKDAFAAERCRCLRAVLNDIFKREHHVTLDRLDELGKRDVRGYLDDLAGMPPYVAARVALLGFDAHAVPVDEQLRAALVARGAADESAEVAELSQWLAYHVKASEAERAHYALQAVSDDSAKGRSRRGAQRARTSRTSGRAPAAAGRGSSRRTKKA